MIPLTFLFFYFYYHRDHRHLHSFPTRRSSDLEKFLLGKPWSRESIEEAMPLVEGEFRPLSDARAKSNPVRSTRSEEHTSELQSRFDLVCRLLLEKKKDKNFSREFYCYVYSYLS